MFFITPLVLAAALSDDSNQSNVSYSSTSPLRVATCAVEPISTNYLGGGGDSGTFLPETRVNGENLYIKFSNSTNKQISMVNFAVTDGANQAVSVVDSGTFSPGVTITHLLKYMPDATIVQPYGSPADDPICTVSSVLFSDGSTWSGPIATAANK